VGFNGPTGIDYSSIPFLFAMYDVGKEEEKEVFSNIRIMERKALEIFNIKK
jgi:hypothetical protein